MNMKFRFLIMFAILLALSGCTPSESSIQTAIAQTQAIALTQATPLPTDTPVPFTLTPTFTSKPPTRTPLATSTPTVTLETITCPGAPKISIKRHFWAQISLHPPISSNVRSEPGLQWEKIGRLKPGEIVWIVDGPRCADNYNWWLVRSTTGLEGWTAEGDTANYWLLQSEDAFFYDTVGQSATSNTVLNRRQNYRITLSGTYSQWVPEQWTDQGVCIRGKSEGLPMFPSPAKTNGPVGADPFYRFARPFYGACQMLLDPSETISPIMLSLDGGQTYSIPVTTVAQYVEDHTYTYTVTGQGYPLKIKLDDAPLNDNYGQILIIIDKTD